MFSSLARFVGISVLVLAVSVSCSDGDADGNGGGNAGQLTINTVVTPGIVVLGGSFEVACPVTDINGTPLPNAVTRYVVDPVVPINGTVATPTEKNTYSVVCMLDSGKLVDPTPARVYVIGQDEVGDVAVDTVLPKDKVAIGESIDAQCNVSIKNEPVDVQTDVTATPADGIQITDHTLVGSINKMYDVACGVTASQFVDPTPATLIVGDAGPPAKVTTQLSKSTAVAGEQVAVTCLVTDSAGNTTQSPTWVEAPAGVGVQEKILTAQQTGTFDITCRLAEDGPTVEHVPAQLVVTSGSPLSITAAIEPQATVYKPGDTITVTWTAADQFGNVVDPKPEATVTAPATGTTPEGNNQYLLTENGYLTFTVALKSNPSITDSVEITVDDSGPIVTIISPDRGTTRDGEATVTVTGTVWDKLGGVKSLTVNGQPVNWDPQGNWTYKVSSVQGMNLVTAQAEDVNGNAGKGTVAWYYSTEFKVIDADKPELAYLDNAVQVWLSQEIIDDKDHTGAIDDLAHLMEILLTYADFTSLIGETVVAKETFPNVVNYQDSSGDLTLKGDIEIWAEIKSISFGQAKLNLDSRDGGVDLKAQFSPEGTQPGFQVELSVHIAFVLDGKLYTGLPICEFLTTKLDPPPQIITTATLDIEDLLMDTSFDIYMGTDGELKVEGKKLNVKTQKIDLSPLASAVLDLGNLDFGFSSPDPAIDLFCKAFQIDDVADFGQVDLNSLVSGFNTIMSGILNVALNNVTPLAVQVLEPLIAFTGGQAIETALKTLEIDENVTVPQLVPGQPESEITVKAKLSEVYFTEAGGTVMLDGMSVAEKSPKISNELLGSITRSQCLGTATAAYELPKTGAMQFALGLDLLNEVLYSTWMNGSLFTTVDGDALSDLATYGISKANIKLQPLLPPIMSDCNAKGTLKVQLGDSYLEASIVIGDTPIDFKAWLSAEIDIGLVAQGSDLGVVINGISQFEIQIFDVQGPLVGMEGALESLIGDVLLEKILGTLASDALGNFPVPQFDLSGLAPGVPDGTKIGLTDMGITKSKGYLQIEGKLQ